MKDPAFLFYSADFMTGTQFFTMEQRGKYISLLCAQHLTGHLSEEDMLIICQRHDERIWKKFIQDEAGLFYNEVLEGHIEKRKDYAESRRNNRLKNNSTIASTDKVSDNKKVKGKKDMNNISLSYVPHMENVNVIENVIINKEDKIKKGAEKLKKEEAIFTEEVMSYAGEYPEDMLKAFLNYWCEATKGKTQMFWQTKTTFEIKRRLVTWSNMNGKGFGKSGSLTPANPKSTMPPASKADAAEERHKDILNDYD